MGKLDGLAQPMGKLDRLAQPMGELDGLTARGPLARRAGARISPESVHGSVQQDLPQK